MPLPLGVSPSRSPSSLVLPVVLTASFVAVDLKPELMCQLQVDGHISSSSRSPDGEDGEEREKGPGVPGVPWVPWVGTGGGSSTLGGMFPVRVEHNAACV